MPTVTHEVVHSQTTAIALLVSVREAHLLPGATAPGFLFGELFLKLKVAFPCQRTPLLRIQLQIETIHYEALQSAGIASRNPRA